MGRISKSVQSLLIKKRMCGSVRGGLVDLENMFIELLSSTPPRYT